VDHPARVEAVAREAAALADALGGRPRDARVPSCPDWAVADLATHVGEFTGFWTHVLCEGTGRPKPPAPGPPPDGDLADWYRGLGDHLVTELRRTPPDTPVWTWKEDDQSAGFVARRCAHELAVHRFDAQLARDRPEPIEPDLAADGIEEVFMFVGVGGRGKGSGESLHLHGTDAGDEWLLTFAPEGLQVARRHGKGDLALRGAVSDLELVLYHRPPVGSVEHHGDDEVLGAWYRAFTF
jgi:uncharacterized protein (TIGR03083 family)